MREKKRESMGMRVKEKPIEHDGEIWENKTESETTEERRVRSMMRSYSGLMFALWEK